MRDCNLRFFSSSLSSRRLTSFFFSIQWVIQTKQTIQFSSIWRFILSNPDISITHFLYIVDRSQHTQCISDTSSNIYGLVVTFPYNNPTREAGFGRTELRMYLATSVVFIFFPLFIQSITKRLYSWIVVTGDLFTPASPEMEGEGDSIFSLSVESVIVGIKSWGTLHFR